MLIIQRDYSSVLTTPELSDRPNAPQNSMTVMNVKSLRCARFRQMYQSCAGRSPNGCRVSCRSKAMTFLVFECVGEGAGLYPLPGLAHKRCLFRANLFSDSPKVT